MEKSELRDALIEADSIRHERHVNYAAWTAAIVGGIVAVWLFVYLYDKMNPLL